MTQEQDNEPEDMLELGIKVERAEGFASGLRAARDVVKCVSDATTMAVLDTMLARAEANHQALLKRWMEA